MKVLWVVGGGIETIPGILIAKEMGLSVAVSDISPDAPGFQYADNYFVVDTYDVNETVKVACDYNRHTPIHGVIAIGSDVSRTVAGVAKAIGLPGPSIETAELTSDKVLMKERFRSNGVPTPWFCSIGNVNDLKRLVNERSYPLVVKPADSRGARGVLRLTSGIDLGWAYRESFRFSPTGRVIAEEWVEGRQISTESIFTEDGMVTPGLSNRNYEYLDRFAPYVIENGGDLPAELTEEEIKEIDKILNKVASCLSMKSGTIKGDIVMSDKGPVIIEIAARLSGGYFCTHTIPLSTGSNIVEAAIRLSLGENIDLGKYAPIFRQHVCQRFVFPDPGIVKKIVIPSDIKNSKNLAKIEIHIKEGDIVQKMTNHPCRAGMIVTVGRSRKESRKNAGEILNKISVLTKQNNLDNIKDLVKI